MLGRLLCRLGFHSGRMYGTTATGLTIGPGMDFYECRRCGEKWIGDDFPIA